MIQKPIIGLGRWESCPGKLFGLAVIENRPAFAALMQSAPFVHRYKDKDQAGCCAVFEMEEADLDALVPYFNANYHGE